MLPTEPGLGDVAFISLVFFANLPFITRRIESMLTSSEVSSYSLLLGLNRRMGCWPPFATPSPPWVPSLSPRRSRPPNIPHRHPELNRMSHVFRIAGIAVAYRVLAPTNARTFALLRPVCSLAPERIEAPLFSNYSHALGTFITRVAIAICRPALTSSVSCAGILG